jgi:hypothetical protein
MSRWKKEIKELKGLNSLHMREWAKTPAGMEYRKKHAQYMKEYRKRNRKKVNLKQQENYDRVRVEVLKHYGGDPPKCACCGEDNLVFLSIDHIKGNGSAHRRKIDPKKKMGGNGFVYWLKKNKFPKGYQILCYNCNFAKRQNAKCPHQTGAAHIRSK